MQAFFFRLTGCLLLPVLIVHNWLRPTPEKGYMPPAYILMHPKMQLRLILRNGWWLTALVLIVLVTLALLTKTA